MSDLDEAKTQFVRDRIKETTFQDRQYIYRLLWLESIIFEHGPRQWSEAMAYGALTSQYPVEAEVIKRELREGKLTTPEEFRALQEKHRRDVMTGWERYWLMQEEIKREQLQEWLKAGGLPDEERGQDPADK